jgi:hypothetical protein
LARGIAAVGGVRRALAFEHRPIPSELFAALEDAPDASDLSFLAQSQAPHVMRRAFHRQPLLQAKAGICRRAPANSGSESRLKMSLRALLGGRRRRYRKVERIASATA